MADRGAPLGGGDEGGASGDTAEAVPDDARELFESGVAFLEDPTGPRYEEAYRAFSAAYRAYPSPKILGNLGLCAMMLERDGEAIAAYRRYLDEVPDIAPEERQSVAKELRVLDANAVPLTLTVTPPALAGVEVVDRREPVKGPPVVNRYDVEGGQLVVRIRAGHHRLEVSAPGHQTVTVELDATPGQRLTEAVTLSPPPADLGPGGDPGPPHTGPPYTGAPFIVAASVTGALGITTAVLAGLAASNHADYEEARVANDRARGEELLDRGEALNLAADVMLGATLAGVAVSTVLLFVDLDPDEPVTVDARLGPSGGAATVRLRF